MKAGRVLWRALQVVKEREEMYGPPVEHWQRTAALASIVLNHEITAEQWGLLMVCDKVARWLGPDGGIDQLVDIAGYADGIGRLRGEPDGDHSPEGRSA